MIDNQTSEAPKQDQQPSSKELNFRALENKYEKLLERERQEKEELLRRIQESQFNKDEQDDDSDPYVDRKKLNRELTTFEKKIEQKFDKKVEEKAKNLIQNERKENWLKNNSDFYEVMQHAEKLYQTDPELADTILEMPESFERQKLVYKNIKALGLHKPKEAQPTIQQKIDANRRSPYYQPSGVGTAPYGYSGDFSPNGQKQAYEKLQELKSRLRL